MPDAKPKGDKGNSNSKNTLMGHLKALRKMLVISLISVGIGFLAVFMGFSEHLMVFLNRPLIERGILIIYTGLAETLVIQMKASFIAGIVIASPVIFWQVWSFLKPALYPRERVKFRMMFLMILSLFVSGVLFAYFLVFNMAVNFFLVSGENIATPMISIERYINMLFGFLLPFGLVFEIPVAVIVLDKLGLVTTKGLIKARKYVIFAVFVLAAMLTPPDVLSQIMLVIPMCLLYEIGVIISRVSSMRRRKSQEIDAQLSAEPIGNIDPIY